MATNLTILPREKEMLDNKDNTRTTLTCITKQVRHFLVLKRKTLETRKTAELPVYCIRLPEQTSCSVYGLPALHTHTYTS